MLVLGIDTALKSCSAAVLDGERPLAERRLALEKGHAEHLAPLVVEVLARAKVAVRDLDRIGVVIGPGGFAGVRVGLAFARGLALGTKLNVVGVTSLEALAAGCGNFPPRSGGAFGSPPRSGGGGGALSTNPNRERAAAPDAPIAPEGLAAKAPPAPPFHGGELDRPFGAIFEQQAQRIDDLIAAVVDAHRGQVYAGLYADGFVLLAPFVATPDEARARILDASCGAAVALVGDGAALIDPDAKHFHRIIADDIDPKIVARLGAAAPEPSAPPAPLYLRPPDAKPPAPSRFANLWGAD